MAKSSSPASVRAIKDATASFSSAAPRMAKKPATRAAEQVAPPLEDDADTSFANFTEMFADFKLPSGRRMLVSVIAQFFVLGTGVYSAIQVGAVLAVGAAVLTGSAFLAFMAGFLTVALGLYTSLIAAARLGKYIALGEIDDDVKRARTWVSGKWSSIKSHFASSNEEHSHV